jgi:glycogen operon protein
LRPTRAYALMAHLDGFRLTVTRLHDAGIEVILDVTYNHTAEGNHLDQALNFRGIDNTSYSLAQPVSSRAIMIISPASGTRSISPTRGSCRW